MRRFVDTNILVYAFDTLAGARHNKAVWLLTTQGAAGELVLSTQVLQEFYNVAAKRLPRPAGPDLARRALEQYARYPLVTLDSRIVLTAASLHQADSISFWDALIVEAARAAGCKELLSEDLQHGRRFGTLTVCNPFL